MILHWFLSPSFRSITTMADYSFCILREMSITPSSQQVNFSELLSVPSSNKPMEIFCADKFRTNNNGSLPVQFSTSSSVEESEQPTDEKKLRDLGKEFEKEKRVLLGDSFYPQPISCLKLLKKGKRLTYMKLEEDEKGRFVDEEIRVPEGKMLRASREGGRLELFFVGLEQEIKPEEKEEQVEEEEEVDVEEREELAEDSSPS